MASKVRRYAMYITSRGIVPTVKDWGQWVDFAEHEAECKRLKKEIRLLKAATNGN